MNYSDFCGRFYFAQDMNGDGIFSISDIWLMIKYVWLLPSRAVVSFFHSNRDWARFFEIDCSTGESFGGFLFSLVAWFFVLCMVAGLLSGIPDSRSKPDTPEDGE